MVLVEGADVEEIVRHLRRGDLEKLRVQVNGMLEMLGDPRLADSLECSPYTKMLQGRSRGHVEP